MKSSTGDSWRTDNRNELVYPQGDTWAMNENQKIALAIAAATLVFLVVRPL